MTFEELAMDLDKELNDNSSVVSDSIADTAKSVTEGTHSLMHDIAISDETAAPDDVEAQQPMAPAMVTTPGIYQPQMPEEQAFEPVLTKLQRLRA